MKILFFLPALVFAISVNAQPMVTVEVSSDTVAIGETVEVTYTIENGEGKLNMPDVTDLPVINGPNSSSSFLYQDGKMSSKQSYSFTLLAMEEGKLVVPRTTYQTENEKLSINPVEIIVLNEHQKPAAPKSITDKPGSNTTREKRKF